MGDSGRKRLRSPSSSDNDGADMDLDGPSNKRSVEGRGRSRSRSHSRERRRTSSSSSSSSDESVKKKKKKKKKEKKEKKEKKSKKDKKSRETSAERSLRKQEKKSLKQELEKQFEAQLTAKMAADLGYSNSENPFGDAHLSQKFVWVKKREVEAKVGLTPTERSRRDMQRKEEVQHELEKLKRRRADREIEMQLREQELARMQRDKDQAALGDWEKREDDFQLNQAKVRAQIRIKEGRAKPIDVLAMNISIATDTEVAKEFDAMGLEMDTEEPYHIFQNLSATETEELHKDIQLYLGLENDPSNRTFWESMLVVCDDELSRQRRSSQRQNPVAASMEADITAMLSGKTYEQLKSTQIQVEKRLSGEDGPVDSEFWEAVLKALIVWKAKARLRDMHKFMLSRRLNQLRSRGEDGSGDGKEKPIVKLNASLIAGSTAAAKTASLAAQAVAELEALADGEDGDKEGGAPVEEYDPSMSPRITPKIAREDRQLEVVDEERDLEDLLNRRRKILSKNSGKPMPPVVERVPQSKDEAMFIAEASRNMEEDEEIFTDETALLTTASYMWQDKYRPRKPRYFNRVHTGYEWNKYNQTHYDTDNPPPKVVQGYKFNVFYPDLIDKTKTPTYKIERDEGYPDTVLLRFIASAPYEDVAFRIVNREWEYSHKNGYRCSFDRGILQLHFHFKRHYYRR
ncbi:hypothetical protein HDU97_008742 [Phlyctochytrium planicorne]|nr:hypothetical protein HDU97_008742 [Phlyctochytrium planicorne]